ncbi:hypothetical protein [Halodurantibacterium flavum]|uniref:Uncharacterized protein n=1 Tax=Halodurantibacterium flavum TaxID=1382802 RepID=A0ABW4S745_9RHOB
MTTLYQAAVRNFDAAAAMLATFGAERFDLKKDLQGTKAGSARSIQMQGFQALGPRFGICLPSDIGALVTPSDQAITVISRTHADWMTIELGGPSLAAAGTCYIEADLRGGSDLVADVFLRDMTGDQPSDGPVTEWHLNPELTLLRLPLPVTGGDVQRRLIVQLRHPPQELQINRFAVTLI